MASYIITNFKMLYGKVTALLVYHFPDRYSGISVDTGNVAATFSPSNVPEVASGCFNTPLNVDVAGKRCAAQKYVCVH